MTSLLHVATKAGRVYRKPQTSDCGADDGIVHVQVGVRFILNDPVTRQVTNLPWIRIEQMFKQIRTLTLEIDTELIGAVEQSEAEEGEGSEG
jgi:hypothetical protein